MTSNSKQILTLDQPVTYQIKVPGELGEGWSDWVGEITVTVGSNDDGLLISTLTGALDQAALQGILRRLYTLGLPLISVIWIETE